MQSFFHQVLSSPRVHAALVAEIEEAVRSGAIAADGNVEWLEAQNLPYFQACLKEAMRVRPAVGLNITRMVPPEGVEIEGQFFRGGTTVALNGWVLHRDREIFGQDADVFRPERWLEDEEEAKTMERYMFQVSSFAITSSESAPPSFATGMLISSLAVWRWQSCLHRPEPGAAGDQQGHPAADARL